MLDLKVEHKSSEFVLKDAAGPVSSIRHAEDGKTTFNILNVNLLTIPR